MSVSFSFHFENNTHPNYFAGLNHNRKISIKPQNIGLVFGNDYFIFALAYLQKYNSNIEYEFPLTTVSDPEGTNSFLQFSRIDFIDTYSAVFLYPIDEYIPGFSVTARIDLDHFDFEEKIEQKIGKLSLGYIF